MRTFISIELPERIRKEIFKEFEKLRGSGFVSGNFVKKENLHLTLKFLGELSEEEISKIKEKLLEVEFSKLNLCTGEIGFFPSENYVRVLWVDLISEKTKYLKDILEEKLLEIGINKDSRPFSSHLTVVRIKTVKDKEKFLEKLKELKVKKLNFEIDKISLVKSELTKKGPVYKILEEFTLK